MTPESFLPVGTTETIGDPWLEQQGSDAFYRPDWWDLSSVGFQSSQDQGTGALIADMIRRNRAQADDSSPLLSADEANSRYGIEERYGVKGLSFDQPVRQAWAEMAFDQKIKEQRYGRMRSQSDLGGFGQGSAALWGGLWAQFTDPVDLGSMFIPFGGLALNAARFGRTLVATHDVAKAYQAARAANEARLATMAAMPIGRRMAHGAAYGALDGALGAALVEPFRYSELQEWQADYTAYDSLMAIGMGAAAGAVFGGLGAIWAKAHPITDTQSRDAHAAAMDVAVRQIANNRPVDVPPLLTHNIEKSGLPAVQQHRLDDTKVIDGEFTDIPPTRAEHLQRLEEEKIRQNHTLFNERPITNINEHVMTVDMDGPAPVEIWSGVSYKQGGKVHVVEPGWVQFARTVEEEELIQFSELVRKFKPIQENGFDVYVGTAHAGAAHPQVLFKVQAQPDGSRRLVDVQRVADPRRNELKPKPQKAKADPKPQRAAADPSATKPAAEPDIEQAMRDWARRQLDPESDPIPNWEAAKAADRGQERARQSDAEALDDLEQRLRADLDALAAAGKLTDEQKRKFGLIKDDEPGPFKGGDAASMAEDAYGQSWRRRSRQARADAAPEPTNAAPADAPRADPTAAETRATADFKRQTGEELRFRDQLHSSAEARAAHGGKGEVMGSTETLSWADGSNKLAALRVTVKRQRAGEPDWAVHVRARHEAFETLLALGKFRPDELDALEHLARTRWAEAFGKPDTKAGWKEAVADAYAHWSTGRMWVEDGKLKSLKRGKVEIQAEDAGLVAALERAFGKIRDFISGLARKAKGEADYRRIFEAIDSGEISARAVDPTRVHLLPEAAQREAIALRQEIAVNKILLNGRDPARPSAVKMRAQIVEAEARLRAIGDEHRFRPDPEPTPRTPISDAARPSTGIPIVDHWIKYLNGEVSKPWISDRHKYGNKYIKFEGNWKGASELLLDRGSGRAKNVFSHPELPGGKADLFAGHPPKIKPDGYYDETGAGLVKIAMKHPEALDQFDRINEMKVVKSDNDKILMQKDGWIAVFAKHKQAGEPDSWFLLSFYKKGSPNVRAEATRVPVGSVRILLEHQGPIASNGSVSNPLRFDAAPTRDAGGSASANVKMTGADAKVKSPFSYDVHNAIYDPVDPLAAAKAIFSCERFGA